MFKIITKTDEIIKLPQVDTNELKNDKVEIESIYYDDMKLLENIDCEIDKINNICNKFMSRTNKIDLKKLLEIIPPKDIEELILLIKEAKEFYIVNDISNCEDFGKHLFERAYKEVETSNKYLKNYIDDTKIFIEDGIYGYAKMKEQNGIVKDNNYISYFGNEQKLEEALKNIGINMIMEENQQEIKLYMPISVTTYIEEECENDEIWGAYKYKEEICKALASEKREEEQTRGLFTYYKEKDD